MRWNLLISCLAAFSLFATQGETAPIPDPPKIAATSYLLLDMNSGRILGEQDADQRIEPASLTKIMTAYSVFRELGEGNIKLTDQVQISKKAWKTPGSRMFIEVGRKVAVEDLLKGLIIQSGNDAGVALAEHIAGSEDIFAELMNSHAAELGMHDSHFVNATGLPHKDHYSTARDIARIAEATIKDFPMFYEWYSIKSFTFNKIKQNNRNKLLWRDKSVDGMKTGHTESAGYCLVTSALRDNMRLISVVTGAKSDNARSKSSQALLRYGFRFYESHKLYSGAEEIDWIRVWKGDNESLALGPTNDVYVTIPRGDYKELDARMVIEPRIVAPVTKGARLGHVRVSLNGEEMARVPLVALQEVAEGSLWTQLVDSLLMLIK